MSLLLLLPTAAVKRRVHASIYIILLLYIYIYVYKFIHLFIYIETLSESLRASG